MTGPADAPWSPDPAAEEGLRRRLGENIRLLRARAHISQEELGFRADVHRTQISLIESGAGASQALDRPEAGGSARGRAGDSPRRHRLPTPVLLRGPRRVQDLLAPALRTRRPKGPVGGRCEPMSVAGQIGLNLRRIRRKGCMSQDDPSGRTGLHHTEISMPERGARLPRLETAVKILEGTDADPGDPVDAIAWHGPARRDDEGCFTIVDLAGPAELRPPRRGRDV